MKQALFWETINDNKIECRLCPHGCIITEGKTGVCRVRRNDHGKLISPFFGKVSSYALDPTEKKPLYHFYPGSYLLSVGTLGCNFKCVFCQNWQISQGHADTADISPKAAVNMVKVIRQRHNSCIGIAYTYSEPLVWYEYVLETCRLAKEHNLVNVLVTNGYINEEPLSELLPLVDAMNIDLKSFRPDYYSRMCKAKLEPVLETIKTVHGSGCHLEITTLVVPGMNDSEREITELVDFISDIDPEIPLHLSRYFPNYQLDIPSTPVEVLVRLSDIAKSRLKYVYVGNVPDPAASNTFCPRCGFTVISRSGMGVEATSLIDNKCSNCGAKIKITGEPLI